MGEIFCLSDEQFSRLKRCFQRTRKVWRGLMTIVERSPISVELGTGKDNQ